MELLFFLVIVFIAYLCGAIPTAAWIAKYKGFDITSLGSKNPGATNIGRFFGLKYFLLVFLIDGAKAFCFLWFLQQFSIALPYQIFGAISLLCGNGFSFFLHGRGGKGISTSVGILFALLPQLLPILFPLWFFIFVLLRTVGIASVTTACALPLLAAIYMANNELLFLCLFVSAWCFVKHLPNIKQFFNVETTSG